MKLPQDFLDRMNTLLDSSEYSEFIKSYDMQRTYGLRVNTLKTGIREFMDISPFALLPVPWVKDGFYYNGDENPGKHPYYHAGLYYIQEPSAMLPGEVANAQPGEYILDLCAAPGGKTVQMAAGMKGRGLLVANDINSDRVKALVKNIEMCGVRNAIVTNESPEILAGRFGGFFDKVLVDAPCSGEGMFRKDEDAARSWEKFKCSTCASMQENILESADRLLKPGGRLVYSTCTFSPQEDEAMVSQFLEKHRDYEVLEIPKVGGMEGGKPAWADGNEALQRTARLWPHKVKGEGHFTALLGKKEEAVRKTGDKDMNVKADTECIEAFYSFSRENLNVELQGGFITKGRSLYWLPVQLPDLSGIRVAKFGWYLGSLDNKRFDPAHSLAVALKREDFKRSVNLSSDSREVISYLKGETLMLEAEKGLTAVCVDGYTLGWAKSDGYIMKNLYPKGWRKQR
jgi:NOL1/NOP2/sun family putative RNA methylase